MDPKPPGPFDNRSCVVMERGVDGYYAMRFKQGVWDGESPEWYGATKADVHRELQHVTPPVPVVFADDFGPNSSARLPREGRGGSFSLRASRVYEL